MEAVERKLAAILAIDVVGFSRMMGADESGTLQRLKVMRAEIIDPAISHAGVRIFKLMGDGILAEFASAVNAVQSAIDIQEQLHRRNADLPPSDVMQLRMGVNLGDVIVEGDDIYGDGVNIAARLEPISDVGGICVSASVRDSARNKVSAEFEDLGERQLKNIDHPVRIYRVAVEGAVVARPARPARVVSGKWLAVVIAAVLVIAAGLMWTALDDTKDSVPPQTAMGIAKPSPASPSPAKPSAKPTIAVLPFVNFSDDKEQEYFSDGLTEDLITDISKVSGVYVIARNSTFS